MERGYHPTKKIQCRTAESYIHDSTSSSYSWLLLGWLAEERVVPSKRLYKCYYDPAGRQYRAKYEVFNQWEKVGLVVVDD
ncbi:Terminal nucleotidyltransferase 5C [Bienertia sinuspersici]